MTLIAGDQQSLHNDRIHFMMTGQFLTSDQQSLNSHITKKLQDV